MAKTTAARENLSEKVIPLPNEFRSSSVHVEKTREKLKSTERLWVGPSVCRAGG